ncbi:hypothetical protein AB1M95_06050 [Sulfitobacter sp. LCG007]
MALGSVLCVWLLLGWLTARFDAAPWLTGALALATLPACRDWLFDSTAALEIDRDRLSWVSGRLSGEIALAEISRVRLDTRLDLSVRMTVLDSEGRRIRLPLEATPPPAELEAQLRRRAIAVERHHFALTG